MPIVFVFFAVISFLLSACSDSEMSLPLYERDVGVLV